MWIPLLSGKPLESFSPSEFKEYVRGLYFRPVAVKRESTKKPLALRIKAKKKGGLSIVTKRSPRYYTPEEYRAAIEGGIPENELFLALKDLGFVPASHAEAREIKRNLDSMPF